MGEKRNTDGLIGGSISNDEPKNATGFVEIEEISLSRYQINIRVDYFWLHAIRYSDNQS